MKTLFKTAELGVDKALKPAYLEFFGHNSQWHIDKALKPAYLELFGHNSQWHSLG